MGGFDSTAIDACQTYSDRCFGDVVFHHLKSRGSGGKLHDPDNLLRLCVNHHNEIHKVGLTIFVKEYPVTREILKSKGWRFVPLMNKWNNPDMVRQK